MLVQIKPRWIEHAIIVLIVYSVVVHFIELEFGEDGWGARFFNWTPVKSVGCCARGASWANSGPVRKTAHTVKK